MRPAPSFHPRRWLPLAKWVGRDGRVTTAVHEKLVTSLNHLITFSSLFTRMQPDHLDAIMIANNLFSCTYNLIILMPIMIVDTLCMLHRIAKVILMKLPACLVPLARV